MGMFDDLTEKVSGAFDDFTSTGAPAFIAAAEDYAGKQLLSNAKENKVSAQKAAEKMLKGGGSPSTGFMASLQGVFGEVGKNVAIKKYGVYVLAGVAAIVVVTLVLRGR